LLAAVKAQNVKKNAMKE